MTVRFLLAFGGAEMAVPDSPNGRSAHEALIGSEAAARLSAAKDKLQRRVPLAKAWLAAMLYWQGHSTAHIARTLRVSDTSVRNMLKDRKG
ncbi:terminase gpP N-terminus-related DNA-binding protein [Pseudotabrizicola algicola]|uniref:terminase gpP N-terminus-related DNA-binding protein n=1 Tax=Pseudotabrizicola algicola TaxID=2709381 RepID=UPI001F072A52|nr:helix-turn-helix domain-containing protein [Pseudotabrizicola algicola]